MARECAAFRVASLSFEEEFLPFSPAFSALGSCISSHYRLPLVLLWEIGVTFLTSSTRIPDPFMV